MRNLAKIGFTAVFGLAVLVGVNMGVSAQGNSGWAHEKNRIRKQQKEYEKDEKRAEKRGYRLYRGGNYYETDQRGYDMIRQAVNRGYQVGYREGANARRYRRDDRYNNNGYYGSGTYGYPGYVDRNQYQYYFREGFERGYRDGYNSQSQYGYYSGGKWNILANVLGNILNMRAF
jgi:hypothetical protein